MDQKSALADEDAVAYLSVAVGVAALLSPSPAALMVTPECVTLRRIIAGVRAVSHSGKLRSGEQRQLRHE
jgi:hypothetical protein